MRTWLSYHSDVTTKADIGYISQYQVHRPVTNGLPDTWFRNSQYATGGGIPDPKHLPWPSTISTERKLLNKTKKETRSRAAQAQSIHSECITEALDCSRRSRGDALWCAARSQCANKQLRLVNRSPGFVAYRTGARSRAGEHVMASRTQPHGGALNRSVPPCLQSITGKSRVHRWFALR